MKITPVLRTPIFTGAPITIKSEDNRNVKYLFNYVKDAISSGPYKTGATFNLGASGEIKISTPPKGLVEYLKSLGIKFIEDKKKI